MTYNFLGNWHDFKLSSYLEFLIQVSAVLIFPLVAIFFFFKYKNLQYQIEHILTTKDRFLDENQFIEFKGQGSKDQITLSLANFLYGKSEDNYVELYYTENDQLKRFLMRSSLSNLSESINNLVIVRCHRSYIVNLLQVSAIKGRNHEMTLTISSFDSSIPVSKSYQETTMESLRKVKNFG
jgi:DNA-binding LytR/AlgR family response regulator